MTILEIAAADYHQDAISDDPSLSASIAKLLVAKTPAHAWNEHPRLNPNFVKTESAVFDLGNCAHQILLEGKPILDVVGLVEADSWRSKDAQALRDEYRANSLIPLLGKDFDNVKTMVDQARAQMLEHHADPALLADGKPERTLVWEEGGVTCRARLDWLRDDNTIVDDLKTSTSADPNWWARKPLYDYGYDLQAAFYLRGVKAVTGTDAQFRFIVVEKKPPYCVTVIQPDQDVLAVGAAKVERALALWRDCLASGVWPAYSQHVVAVSPPAWQTPWLDDPDLETQAWEAFAA